MTAEEHDRAYTKNFEREDLLRGYIECDAIAQRLASKFPEDHMVWIGTVSQRLAYMAGLLTNDMEFFSDMISKSPLKRVVFNEATEDRFTTGEVVFCPVDWEFVKKYGWATAKIFPKEGPKPETIGFFPIEPKTMHEEQMFKPLKEETK